MKGLIRLRIQGLGAYSRDRKRGVAAGRRCSGAERASAQDTKPVIYGKVWRRSS